MKRSPILAGLAALTLLVLAGCEPDKGTAEDTSPIDACTGADGDEDGVTDCDGDCDDAEAAVFPGAVEICDGLDNDCDDHYDSADSSMDPSSLHAWYTDQDGDLWGDDDKVSLACDPPFDNSVLDGGDCDDDDADINPGALEVCNGRDDDCDGAVDVNAVDGTAWFPDADGDDYGADDGVLTLCEETEGYVEAGGDCDEADKNVNPGADETCFNDIDDDCDGEADDACPIPVCGDITSDTTWDDTAVGYYVSCDISVLAELTVAPDVTVYFASDTEMNVGVEGEGALVVDAPADHHVRFMSGVPLVVAAHEADVGEWTGLIFGSETNLYTTVLDGLEVYQAGGDGSEGAVVMDDVDLSFANGGVFMSGGDGLVALNGAFPEVLGATLAENTGHGFYADDTSGPSEFADNILMNNLSYPVSVLFRYGGVVEESNLFDEHSSEQQFIELREDTVEDSVRLTALDYPYYVSGEVAVYGSSGPVLELADDVHMSFAYGAGLSIGSLSMVGDLIVDGDVDGVTLDAVDAARGWDGLKIRKAASNVSLLGLTINDGGGNGYGALYFEGVLDALAASVSNSTFARSSTHGVYIGPGVTPRIQGSEFTENAGYGVYIYDGGSDEGGLEVDAPSFTDNQFYNNASPMQVPAAYVDQLDSENTFSSGTGAVERVEVTGSTVTRTGTWHKLDVDYEVTGPIVVAGSAAPVLSIEADTVFYMHDGAGVEVGDYADGGLNTADPVTFTSDGEEPGDWNGIMFSRYTLGSSTLDGLHVLYGGGEGEGAVTLDSAEASFKDCVIAYSAGHGAYVDGSATVTPEPSFEGCRFEENEGDGLYVDSNGGLGTFEENSFSGNAGYPVTVNVDYAGALDAESTYSVTGDGRVFVLGETLSADATWAALDAPWLITDDVTVSADLTISPGATLNFAHGAGLTVGSRTAASLHAEGTSARRITFTSDEDVPEAGDWVGVSIKSRCDPSALAYVDIFYGENNLYLNCDEKIELSDARLLYGETADLSCGSSVDSTDGWDWSTLTFDVQSGCTD